MLLLVLWNKVAVFRRKDVVEWLFRIRKDSVSNFVQIMAKRTDSPRGFIQSLQAHAWMVPPIRPRYLLLYLSCLLSIYHPCNSILWPCRRSHWERRQLNHKYTNRSLLFLSASSYFWSRLRGYEFFILSDSPICFEDKISWGTLVCA